ncbi:D-alanyl-D-alanine carboxypeptidase family protein [Anaeromicropila populeti]|nr:D-alanyl-D-alanine carboxypeptidase family protein [Anaeromicropila populeti]
MIIIILLTICSCLEVSAPIKADEIDTLYARSACLVDGSNGRVLYEKDGYKEMPMASTTKIMTCIVTLEQAKLDDVVTISKNAARQPDVQLNVNTGEQYCLKDLLYSLMLESHNDAAVAIAEHVGGSVEGFADLMNQKAKELGCEHTNFVTPNGLDADGHYTTAVELAEIARYAIQNKTFIGITNTPSWSFKEITKGRGFTVTNKDKFLYLYDGAIGVKTGFTGKAGYCFVGAVKKPDRTLISVVLACGWPPNKNYKWSDTKKLMNYGVNNYTLKEVFEADKDFQPVMVEDGKKNSVRVVMDSASLEMLLREDEKIQVVYSLPDKLEAPVEKKCVVGKASYYLGNTLIQQYPIYTVEEVERVDYLWYLEKVFDLFLF